MAIIMSNVKIISDGTAKGTKVFVNEEYIKGLTKIEIAPIQPGGIVTAMLTVDVCTIRSELMNAEVECTDILTADRIKTALLGFDS